MTPAITPQLEEEAFVLRHRIYCEAMRYEPCDPSGKERDAWDNHATQMLLYNEPMDSFVGCLRLIHPWSEGRETRIPFENHCQSTLDHGKVNAIKASGPYAEASRFGIDNQRIRSWKDHEDEKIKEQGQMASLLLLPAMYFGLHALAEAMQIQYIFAIVEPRLLENMNYYKVAAEQIGSEIEHRGTRVPIMVDVNKTISGISPGFQPLYTDFLTHISGAFENSGALKNKDRKFRQTLQREERNFPPRALAVNL